MIRIEFTQEEIDVLDYERYHYPHPMIQKRTEALFLKSRGYKHKDICGICRICKTSLAAYLKDYRDGGIDALKQLRFKRQSGMLNFHAASLEEYFREHPPRTVAEALAVIEERSGIKRGPTQIGDFLKRIGMKVRKVGSVPGKARDED
ncbi:MAG: helix-turn-helix domain-containing protein [Gammaproteobacteria bacterium]|nr:helix-turn-helix domain-containing protein [Gammaproteobacteria bacterium]